MVDGRLLQMNKSYGQLKQKQKEKISEWMYQAYRKQTKDNLSDEETLQFVFDRIEEAKIWIPDYEIVNRYRVKKSQLRKRLVGENVPQHIYVMESILDKASQKMDALEKKIEEYEAFQRQMLKHLPVIMDRDSPFRIMINLIGLIHSSPGTVAHAILLYFSGV